MGILEDLQIDIASEKPVGPILLKLRLLAAKLGSADLEEWVRHEAEGYPQNAEVPEYRELGMSFIGQFSSPLGMRISDAPIPPYLIGKFAGDHWRTHKMRYSAASIDAMISEGGGLHLDLADLSLLIQGKVYKDMACNQLTGYISHSSVVEVANAIRNRILELTIEIERSIPSAVDVELAAVPKTEDIATQIFYQTIYGGMTNIHSTGEFASIQVAVAAGSPQSLLENLLRNGLDQKESNELSSLIAAEKSTDPKKPLGEKTRKWLADRVTKGADSGIAGGLAALTKIAQEAAMQYWNLK